MSRLYLRCVICGRQQADGLLSRSAWGHVERADRTSASACPSCKEAHSDWEERLQAGNTAPRYGGDGLYQSA
jgi:hypothetical protein